MKKLLLCFITNTNDYNYIDSRLEFFTEENIEKGFSVVYQYVVKYSEEGLTQTDIDEIDYILQSNKDIHYILFILASENIIPVRKSALIFIDRGYIVLFDLK